MSTVFVLKSKAFLITSLIERLQGSFAVLEVLDPVAFVDTYSSYILGEGSGVENEVTFIFDTCNKYVNDSLSRLSEKSLIMRFPKVIVVSSLSSYGGGLFSKSKDTLSTIYAPFANYRTNYVAELAFQELAELTDIDITVISAGLLYGSSGLDFEDVFAFMASGQFSSSAAGDSTTPTADSLTLPTLFGGQDSPPIVYVKDYVDIVKACIEREKASPSESHPKRLFVAENKGLKVTDIFSKTAAAFDKQSAVLSSGYASSADAILARKDCQLLWSTHWSPADAPGVIAPSTNYLDNLSTVVEEYLMSRNLQPCSLAIIGKPFCGKTSLAKRLASDLKIEYVEMSVALLFVLVSTEGASVEADQRRSELIEVVKSSKADEKKGAKKGEESPPLDLSSVTFNEALIKMIPRELQLQCLKIYLAFSKQCKSKGFVLDVWCHGAVAAIEEIYDLGRVEMVVELSQPEASLKKRFADHLGISDDPKAKNSKEQTSALKDFEDSLAHYSDQAGDVDAMPAKFVHYSLDESDAGAVASDALARFLQVHGPVGWLGLSAEGNVDADLAGYQQVVSDAVPGDTPVVEAAVAAFTEDTQIRKYLDTNVSRVISEITIACQQQRSDDPIAFLARDLCGRSEATVTTAQSKNEELLKSVLQTFG